MINASKIDLIPPPVMDYSHGLSVSQGLLTDF